jgi:hypothetical protein
MLINPFSVEEVKEALESIGDLKAPGPDGMPAVFYKKFWHIVGEKIQQEVIRVLNGGDNHCLNPKGEESGTNFRIPSNQFMQCSL